MATAKSCVRCRRSGRLGVSGMLLLASVLPAASFGQRLEPLTELSSRASNGKDAAGGTAPATSQIDAKQLREWIDQLGSDLFLERRLATEQIAAAGLAAYDMLAEAVDHPTVEIQFRVRSLLDDLRVRGAPAGAGPAIVDTLTDYADLPEDRRLQRIERLQQFGTESALAALCRISRAEQSERLSRHAAIAAMAYTVPPLNGDLGSPDGDFLERQLGNSTRPGAAWIRAAFVDETSPTDWSAILRQQSQSLLDGAAGVDSTVVRQLTAWVLKRLTVQGRLAAAMQLALRQLEGSNLQLLTVVELFLDHRAWAEVEQLKQQFETEFAHDENLMYRYAEALLNQGQRDAANDLAEEAFKQVSVSATQRYDVARALQRRGMFEWAEREFRDVIESQTSMNQYSIYGSYLLAEMLHDQQRDLDAANVLQRLSDEAAANPQFRKLLDQVSFTSTGSVNSRMHYFYAEHARLDGDRDKQLDHLKQGTVHDPTDADLLIGRYRLEQPDEEFHRETKMLINQAVIRFRSKVSVLQQQLERQPERIENFAPDLAQNHNQLAWLVGNTEGNIQEAIESSRTSLRLSPGSAGYLDTLARCLYTDGQLDAAIATQRRALTRDPHSGQLQRQLEFFLTQANTSSSIP